jgi:hypothetical protein
MTALSKGLPYPFLPLDLHFCREDHCLEMFFTKKQIPQYHISTRLKGHNCTHPKKRLGTSTLRGGELYKKYEKQCNKLIHKLTHEN